MSMRPSKGRESVLSDRRQRVLAALIEEYVARALPVGSHTLTERYSLGVSSATVRNELSYLEEGGYIEQPYTSAGRIPTDFGYRAFVDDLLRNGTFPADAACENAIGQLRQTANELDQLLEQTSSALSRLTNCLSVVLAPSLLDARIRQITLISLAPRKALAVVVTEDGQVFNRQTDFDTDVLAEDLAGVQAFLNGALTGKTLHEVESGLHRGLHEAQANALVRQMLAAVLACLQEGQQVRSHRLGLGALLAQPEFSHSSRLLPLMEVLEDDTVLLEILDDAAQGGCDMPQVSIGSENHSKALNGVSVVASPYGHGRQAGVVAVIGPTRMDYSKVIQAVRAASASLSEC